MGPTLVRLGVLLAFTSVAGGSIAAPQRFFVVIHGVEQADSVKSDAAPELSKAELLDELKRLFAAEIARHPELALASPGIDPSAEPQAFKDALRKAGFARALDVSLRVLELSGGIEPPPPGKPFRTLSRSIKLAVFGTTLPEKIMAIGGDGDSNIAAEIRKSDDEKAEAKKLLVEASTTAIKQAVDMTVTKLELPPAKDPKPKKKK